MGIAGWCCAITFRCGKDRIEGMDKMAPEGMLVALPSVSRRSGPETPSCPMALELRGNVAASRTTSDCWQPETDPEAPTSAGLKTRSDRDTPPRSTISIAQ